MTPLSICLDDSELERKYFFKGIALARGQYVLQCDWSQKLSCYGLCYVFVVW